MPFQGNVSRVGKGRLHLGFFFPEIKFSGLDGQYGSLDQQQDVHLQRALPANQLYFRGLFPYRQTGTVTMECDLLGFTRNQNAFNRINAQPFRKIKFQEIPSQRITSGIGQDPFHGQIISSKINCIGRKLCFCYPGFQGNINGIKIFSFWRKRHGFRLPAVVAGDTEDKVYVFSSPGQFYGIRSVITRFFSQAERHNGNRYPFDGISGLCVCHRSCKSGCSPCIITGDKKRSRQKQHGKTRETKITHIPVCL